MKPRVKGVPSGGNVGVRAGRGFSMVELLVALALSTLILVGGVEILRYMVLTVRANGDETLASLQVQYAGFWINEDTLQAERVSVGNGTWPAEQLPGPCRERNPDGIEIFGFPLTLGWVDGDGGNNTVVYSLVMGNYTLPDENGCPLAQLRRNHECLNQDLDRDPGKSQGESVIGDYLDPGATGCYLNPVIGVAAGEYHTVAVKSRGIVVGAGANDDGQRDVATWMSVFQVAAGGYHTVGLEWDGTVVAVGRYQEGQRHVSGWTDIVRVAAGMYHTVGLRGNGTVVAVGLNDDGQCGVGIWTNIAQVAAGGYHTVGLDWHGTVVAVGSNAYGQRDVGDWTGIEQVAAGGYHTVGLGPFGTVVAAGGNESGQCGVDTWGNVTQVAAGMYHTVGLRGNGTLVAVGSNAYGQCDVGNWTGIRQVAAGAYHTVGLRSDGTVVAVGRNDHEECDTGSWTPAPLTLAVAATVSRSGRSANATSVYQITPRAGNVTWVQVLQ